MKIHRIKEVFKNHSGKKKRFPVAGRRREQLLRDEDFGAPEELSEEDEPPELGDELPDLVETSDDEDEKFEFGAAGSSPKGEVHTNHLLPPVWG